MPSKRRYKCYVFTRVRVIRVNTLGAGLDRQDFIIKNRFELLTTCVGRIGGIACPRFTVIPFVIEIYGKPSRFFSVRSPWRKRDVTRVVSSVIVFFIRTRDSV